MVLHTLKIFSLLLLTTIFIGCSSEKLPQESEYFTPVPDSFYEGISFDMPKVQVPQFPDYSVNVEEFGAVPDGNTLNTEAFRKVIEHVAEQGGGRVVIPRGIWKTGPITLQSNINLHAEKGALIIFSENISIGPNVQETEIIHEN